MYEFSVVVPTYNAGPTWKETINGITKQALRPEKVLVVDSSSSDATAIEARAAGFEVVVIDKGDFDHGGTRTFSLRFIETEYVIFLTQDAVLDNDSAFQNLINIFSDVTVSAAYGRQLPHHNANILARYARKNSYGESSYTTTLTDSFPKGFRKAFLSNSFAAYRVADLNAYGGFPKKLIMGEDSYIAAKALLAGKSVAYVANALVRHSHNYKIIEEFRRYFDIGVFHTSQPWMLEELGDIEGEGLQFALGQVRFIFASRQWFRIPESLFASCAKYVGYKVGRYYKKLPVSVCRRMSMYRSYWG